MRALARERADRFGSAKELARALQLSCPELLFDQDQRSTFMAEMFEAKLAATQALLESAGGEMGKAAVLNAVSLLREDAGASFPELNPKPPKGRKRAVHQPPVRKHSGELEVRKADQAVALAVLTGPEAAPVPKTNPEVASPAGSHAASNLVLVAIAALTAVGAWAVYHFIWNPEPAAEDAQPFAGDVPFTGKLEPLPASVLTGANPHAAPVAPASQKAPAVLPAPKAGWVTLAILPEATVFKGKTELGKTPLFNFPLPVGTHLLTVVGDDKVKRGLSVQIQPAKNTAFKMQLSDIPASK
jgi:hypothetical protein